LAFTFALDTHAQKISLLRSLYHLASADDELKKVELVYIKNVAKFIGVDAAELEALQPGEPDLELPDREYKVYAIFHRLAAIIMIDGDISPREHRYCFNLGIKMGLHPNAIGEIIKLIAEKGVMNAMPSEVMDIFRKYLS
jgi:hypothetical protein